MSARSIRVEPLGLLAILAAQGARVRYTVDAHDVPRVLFDAIEGVEEEVKSGDYRYWRKRLATEGDGVARITLYCAEPVEAVAR